MAGPTRHRCRRWALTPLAAACLALGACDALLTEPASRGSEISLQFQLDEAPIGGTSAAFSRVERVSLRLARPDSAFRDTVLVASPTDGTIRVALTVEGDEQISGLGIAARLGTADADLFQGGTVVALVPGEPVQAEIPLLPVPVALDADRDSLIFASVLDTVRLSTAVLYATGDTVDGLFGVWTSADPTIVAVSPVGTAVALLPGQTVLEARLDTIVDTVFVEVPPPPVPELVTWLDPLGGNWSDGTRWSRGAPPIAGDTVEITLDGTYTVVQDVDPPALAELTLGGASGAQTLEARGRALSVAGGVTVTGGGTLDLGAGGSVVAPGGIVLDGVAIEVGDNGSLSAPTISVAAGSTLGFGNLATVNGALAVDGLLRVDQGGVSVTGALTTSASTTVRVGLAGTVSRLNLVGGLVNNGSIEMDGTGQLDLGGGTLVNAAGASIDVSVGPAVGNAQIIGSLNNLGTLTMSENVDLPEVGAVHANAGSITTSGAAWLRVLDADAFSNGGPLDAAGNVTMRFTGTGAGLTNTSTMTLGAGLFMEVEGGPFSMPSGSISGGGTMRLVGLGGTITAAADLGTDLPAFFQLESSSLAVPVLTVASGTQLLLQASTLTADLDLVGGLGVVGAGTSVVTGAMTTGATSRITIEGGSIGDPTLSVPAGYTNNGITELTSSQAGSSATLTTPTLTNNLGAQVQTAGSQPGTFTIVGDVTNQDFFGLQQDLTIQGAFTDQGTFTTLYQGNGSALVLQGLNIWNATFDNVRVVSVGGAFSNFNAATFSNMDPTVAQLSLTHPGSALGAFAMTGLVFNTVPTTGSYMSLSDPDGGPVFLTVNVLSSTPASGSALSVLLGGALLNW